MTSQEAKQHIKKAQENPDKYHFEWFFDDEGEEITPEPEPEPQHIFQTEEFKALNWKQKLYVRIKVAVWETLMMR